MRRREAPVCGEGVIIFCDNSPENFVGDTEDEVISKECPNVFAWQVPGLPDEFGVSEAVLRQYCAEHIWTRRKVAQRLLAGDLRGTWTGDLDVYSGLGDDDLRVLASLVEEGWSRLLVLDWDRTLTVVEGFAANSRNDCYMTLAGLLAHGDLPEEYRVQWREVFFGCTRCKTRGHFRLSPCIAARTSLRWGADLGPRSLSRRSRW